MQFHHHGYVSTDPRVQPAAGSGLNRPDRLPDEVDVLIVGAGPAGVLMAAQLAQFPSVTTRLIERRPHRLEVGQADGIQVRTVETFQAFGFANRIIEEAFWLTHTNFWAPDPENPKNIIRTARTEDDPAGLSEFPHIVVNQARVLDYFIEAAENAPARVSPDYGIDFLGLSIDRSREYPVAVRVLDTESNEERTIHARYVLGSDGARSRVRESIGRKHVGGVSLHAWAVLDSLSVTDFPDVRTKCAIQSEAGSILLIPREGGYLFRLYVDLGEVAEDDNGNIRTTPVETAIEKANAILHPYTLDVKDVAWYSVYEVGHRVTDKFDDSDAAEQSPHVFIAGDACHTHSAKAGQGMNVSMQDAFNLGWKLGQVLEGRSPESLLHTYSAERHEIAQNLIDFDLKWSSMMAKKPEEFESPEQLAQFFMDTQEFPTGLMTQYPESEIIGSVEFQSLASGFPIGKRFKSFKVDRIADGNPVHLGHHHRADGRWRIYAFSDGEVRANTALSKWAEWMQNSSDSPIKMFTPLGSDIDSVFDVKVIYPQSASECDVTDAPGLFLPRSGPFQLIDYEKVYAARASESIFEARGIDPAVGAVVVVRPDQYVAHVLPLDRPELLTQFLRQSMLEVR